LALLARVANALFKSDVVAPQLSAVNEATVAAIFAQIGGNLVIELDYAKEDNLPSDYDIYHWRKLIAGCQEPPRGGDDFHLDVKCADLIDWEVVIECLTDRILWDADWDIV
jgi:hypothetical protein